MRRFVFTAVAVLATAAACKTESPEVMPRDVSPGLSAAALDSVKAVDAAFATAFNAKDTASLWANYADDAKLLAPDAPILDVAGGRPVVAGFMAAGATNFVLTPSIAYGTGDLAYMVGTATYAIGKDAFTIKYTEVLRRGADGRWRYVVDMFSDVKAPAASTPAAPAAK